MYNIKSKYIVNQNDNGTLTIYDLENEQYYEINEIGGIIFNNINRDISDILIQIKEVYEDNESLEKDVSSFYKELLNTFFAIE